MHINKVISFNSSWGLLKDKSSAYEDICQAISRLDKDSLSNPDISSPSYRIKEEGKLEISPMSFNRAWETFMEDLGWDSYRMRSETPGGINLYIRHFKNGVATKIMATDRMLMFPNWVLVEAPKVVGTEFCELSVLIVPMESVSELYDDERRMRSSFFFEKSLAQLTDLLPLNQKEPFLVIGISNEELPIEVIEFFPNESENLIERVLEFPKEHYQAGVGILSYFGEIIKQKYPDIDAKVRIEQDGGIVRMIVDTPDGSREIIEKTLDDYALVVRNKAAPESLLEDKLHIHALTNKLSIAELEVKQTRDLLQISNNYASDKIKSLEEDVGFLRTHVGQQIHHMNTSQSLIHHQSQKEEKLLLAQIDNSQRTIDDLIQESWNKTELKNALEKINEIVTRETQPEDEAETKNALVAVRDTSPEALEDLSDALKNTMYGVSGNIVFQWLQQISCLIT